MGECRNYDRVPEIATKVQLMDREIGEVSASSKSAHNRIDNLLIKLGEASLTHDTTSDAFIAHMSKEEGMNIVIASVLSVIVLIEISFMSWAYLAHVENREYMAKQQVIVENNQKMIEKNHKMMELLIQESKQHGHKDK